MPEPRIITERSNSSARRAARSSWSSLEASNRNGAPPRRRASMASLGCGGSCPSTPAASTAMHAAWWSASMRAWRMSAMAPISEFGYASAPSEPQLARRKARVWYTPSSMTSGVAAAVSPSPAPRATTAAEPPRIPSPGAMAAAVKPASRRDSTSPSERRSPSRAERWGTTFSDCQ